MAHHAEVHNPAVVEGDQCFEQEACFAAGCPLVEMHVTNWAKAQKEDTMFSTVLDLAEGTEADRFEDASGRTHLQ